MYRVPTRASLSIDREKERGDIAAYVGNVERKRSISLKCEMHARETSSLHKLSSNWQTMRVAQAASSLSLPLSRQLEVARNILVRLSALHAIALVIFDCDRD